MSHCAVKNHVVTNVCCSKITALLREHFCRVGSFGFACFPFSPPTISYDNYLTVSSSAPSWESWCSLFCAWKIQLWRSEKNEKMGCIEFQDFYKNKMTLLLRIFFSPEFVSCQAKLFVTRDLFTKQKNADCIPSLESKQLRLQVMPNCSAFKLTFNRSHKCCWPVAFESIIVFIECEMAHGSIDDCIFRKPKRSRK